MISGSSMLLGGDVRAHHARERAFIGECERPVAQALGLGDELLGLRSAAQKREIAQGMQFGVHAPLSSEYAVQIPTLGLPLLKNPQPGAARAAHDVVVACDIACRPTSRSRCVQGPVRESNPPAAAAALAAPRARRAHRAATRAAACRAQVAHACGSAQGCGVGSAERRHARGAPGIVHGPAAKPPRADARGSNRARKPPPRRAGRAAAPPIAALNRRRRQRLTGAKTSSDAAESGCRGPDSSSILSAGAASSSRDSL